MKKWGVIVITAFLLAALLGACKGSGQTLSCTVTEVYENAVMVTCAEESEGFAQGEKVYVSCETMPALAPGDAIRVTFSGQVMISEPAQIVADKIELQ